MYLQLSYTMFIVKNLKNKNVQRYNKFFIHFLNLEGLIIVLILRNNSEIECVMKHTRKHAKLAFKIRMNLPK